MQQVKLLETSPKLVIGLSGEIESTKAEDFYIEVRAIYLNDKKNIEFDCTSLTFIDSTTLGTFVKILKMVKEDGNTISLNHVSSRIRKLFTICTLDKIMEINS